jgi:hypothetical protein
VTEVLALWTRCLGAGGLENQAILSAGSPVEVVLYRWMYIFFAEFVFGIQRMGMSIGKGNNDGIQNRSVSGGRCKMRHAREENAQSDRSGMANDSRERLSYAR